jgi:hypothetical protein
MGTADNSTVPFWRLASPLPLETDFQFGFNDCQVLHMTKSGIQITLFPLPAGGLPPSNAFHVVHPVDQVAVGMFPNLPPQIIIVKSPVNPLSITLVFAPSKPTRACSVWSHAALILTFSLSRNPGLYC